MKNILYIVIILFAKVSLGQNDSTKIIENNKPAVIVPRNDEIFIIVEQMPEFPTGMNGMMEFIQTNISYPKEAKEKNWEGKTFVSFIVTKDGDLVEVKIRKSSNYQILDDEAIRVIKAMPKWKSGMQNGKAVPVMFNIPFNFTLPKQK